MRKIIMRDQADKSWINKTPSFTQAEVNRLSSIKPFSKEETKELEDIEYQFMKNLLKVLALAALFMALAHHFKL